MAKPYYPNANKKLYFPEHNDSALEIFGKGVVKGFLNVGAGLVGTTEELLELTPWVGEGNFLEGVRTNIRAEEAEWETNPEGKIEWVANVVGQALPYMGSAMTGHAGFGLLGSAGVGFAVEGQDAYEAAKKRGATEGQANLERGIVGGINASIEALQMGRLFKFAGKGKHTFKAFRKLAAQKAFGKMAQEGVRFGKDILINSIEEAAEEFLQEGVSLTVPYFVEGREEFGDLEYFQYLMANKEQLGAAALGGAVVSPFLGMARAAIPTMAGPGLNQIQRMREDVQGRDISNEQKAAMLRDIDKFEERVYGEVQEVAKEVNPDNAQAQRKHATLIDRMEDTLDSWEETRPEYEKGIKEERGKRFGEVENYVKETINNSDLDPRVRMIAVRQMMKGKMGQQYDKLLDQDFTVEEYQTLIDTAMKVHQDSATDLLKSLDALEKMFIEGELPQVNEIKTLEPILGKSFVKKAVKIIQNVKSKPKTLQQKVLGHIKETMNFPRAVLASIDFSAVGRQGALMAFMKPKAWLQGVASGYRAFFSEDYADYIDLLIKTNPNYDKLRESGVFLSERGKLSESEEFFASRLAHKLPGIRASERAYVTSLNTMRAQAFYSIANQWAGHGKSGDLPELAKVLNHITGRGNLGDLKKLSPALNIMFFAPKLQIARVQTLTDLIPIHDGKFRWSPTQKILAATLAEAFGTGMLLLWLLSMREGVTVESDPRSSDFGKVRMGDTRIDFWGGYTQLMRLVANIATGEIKSSSGELYDVSVTQTIGRYLQTKLSPVAGLALDTYRGEDFKGSILEPTLESGAKQFYQRFTPLFIQDTADALYYQGLNTGSALTSGLALHGVGAMTYPVSDSSQAMLTKNHYAQNTYGEKWNDLGPVSQQLLRISNPLIDETERQARKERVSKKAKARVLREMRKSERKLERSLSEPVRNELDRLLVNVGGVGRRLSEDWYLNDAKYKQYQVEVAAALNDLLPRFTELDLEPELKRVMLEEVISKIKSGIRQQIVNEAKIEDIQRL